MTPTLGSFPACLLSGALLAAVPLAALDPGTPPDGYVHQSWTIADGLPQSSVTDIVRTRDGYLWLTTFGGLARFDGLRFTVFDVATAPGMTSNRLTALHEDARGVLWIGSEKGLLIRYEGGRFTTFGPEDGLPAGAVVWDLLDDGEGALWIATGKGVARWADGEAHVFTALDGIGGGSATALALDVGGRLWAATGRGVAGWRGGAFELFELPGLNRPQAFFRALLGDREGGLRWLLIRRIGHFEDGRYETWLELELEAGGPGPKAMLEDRDGNLWFGSRGLTRIREMPAGRSAERVLDVEVRALYEDRDGGLWIGTNAAGLHLLRDSAFSNLAGPGGQGGTVILEREPGEVLFGLLCGGLWRWDEGPATLTPVELPAELGDCVSALLADRAGRLWVGARVLARRDPASWKIWGAETPARNISVRALLEDRRGRVWFGTPQGLGRVDGDRVMLFTTRDGLVDDDVRFLTEDRRGDLWAGGPRGMTRFAGGAVASAAAKRYTIADGLPHDFVRAIHEAPDGALWIGTYGGGLARFDPDTETFAVLTSRDGLAENAVSRILEDDADQLWLSGNRGITRLDRADAEAFLRGEHDRVAVVLYDEVDGMAVAETNGGSQPAGWRARDGRLWFPTIAGVVALDPARLRPGVPPPVTIEHVRAGRREVAERGPVIVPPGNRDLEIDYVGLQLGLPDEVVFRYRLAGHDDDWLEVGNRRTAFYTDLDPGVYRFEVTAAAHAGGAWNSRPAAREVVVEPLVWEILWFRVGATILALGLMAGGAGWRVASVRRRNAELEAVNAELEARNAEMERFNYTVSHDLKTPLVTIRGFIGLAQKDADAGHRERLDADLEQINSAAAQMARLLDDILELSRAGRIVGTMGPVALTELAGRAVSRAAGALEVRGVEVVIDADLPVVHGDAERLVEVFQNLIENAERYMGDQERPRIEIGWRRDGGEEVVTVRDNGIGVEPRYHELIFRLFERLDARTEGTGVGLAMVKRIVESHGGRVWVESEGTGKGSTFCFTLDTTPVLCRKG